MVRYTTAPEVYDGFGTETVERMGVTNRNGDEWRRVEILDEHADWQIGRYNSGLHPALVESDFIDFRERGLL